MSSKLELPAVEGTRIPLITTKMFQGIVKVAITAVAALLTHKLHRSQAEKRRLEKCVSKLEASVEQQQKRYQGDMRQSEAWFLELKAQKRALIERQGNLEAEVMSVIKQVEVREEEVMVIRGEKEKLKREMASAQRENYMMEVELTAIRKAHKRLQEEVRTLENEKRAQTKAKEGRDFGRGSPPAGSCSRRERATRGRNVHIGRGGRGGSAAPERLGDSRNLSSTPITPLPTLQPGVGQNRPSSAVERQRYVATSTGNVPLHRQSLARSVNPSLL